MVNEKTYLRYAPTLPFGLVTSPTANALFSPTGQLITPALEDVLIWDSRTGTLVSRWHDSTSPVSSIIAHATLYAVGHVDGSIRLWKDDALVCILNGHKTAVTSLAFSADGEMLASGGSDTDLVIWDVGAEEGLKRLRGHKDVITGIVWLDEGHVATCSKDCLVKVWDLKGGWCVETVIAHRSEVWGLALNGDGKLVTAAQDNEVRVWAVDMEGLKGKLGGNNDEDIKDTVTLETTLLRQSKERTVSLRAWGRFFAVQAADKTIEVFKSRNQDEIRKRVARLQKRAREKNPDAQPEEITVDSIVPHSILRCSSKIRSFDVSHVKGDAFSLLCALANNSVEVYKSVEEGDEPFKIVSTLELQGHRTDVRCVALSSDDELIASGSNGSIKVWNAATKQCIKTLVDCGYVLCLSFVPGNKHLIVGTKEGNVHLYDLSSSSLIESVEAHEGAVWGLQVRPDKTGFATGSADKEVKFWDFCLIGNDGGKRLSISHTRTLKMSDDVLAVVHSPDGRLIAVSLLDATVKVFFTDSLKFSLSLYGHKLPVLSMDISSDSTIIATASADKSVKLWGLDFGDCHRSLLAHTDSVMGVKFSWGTHYFFTVSKDKNVKYWDADAGSAITTLEAGHHGEVWGLAVAKYGAFVVTGSHDRSLRVWNKTDEQLFMEEEREREMDDMFERSAGRDGRDEGAIGSGALDGAGDLIGGGEEREEDGGGEAGLAGAKSKDTLKAGEKLFEALEIWAEERGNLEAWKLSIARGDKGVVKPTVSPFIVALGDADMTPELYVLHVLERVRASDLEQALVVLPFVRIEDLLTCIASWSEQKISIQLTTKVLTFIYRLHFNQITSSISASRLKPLMERIRVNNEFQLGEMKDRIGFNASALRMLMRSHEARTNCEFFGDDFVRGIEKAGKGGKKRKGKRSDAVVAVEE